MNCRRVEPLLSKHLEGRLSAREAQVVASHLEGCQSCRQLRGELWELTGDLRDMPRLPLSPDTPHRIAGRWLAEREGAAPHWRRGFLALSPPAPLRWAPLGTAALVVLAVGLGLTWWGHGKGNEPSGLRGVQHPRRAQIPSAPSTLPPGVSQRDRRMARVQLTGPVTSSPSHPFLTPLRAGRSAEKKQGAHVSTAGPRSSKPVGGDRRRLDRVPVERALEWSPVPADAREAVERRVRLAVPMRDDFVQISFPRIASTADGQVAAAAESYKREAAIVDPRLSREVTLQQKATALSDLCERLRADTGIQLAAGQSVADEKVTLFCEQQPLRDVMRQLSRPFGYAWLRSKKEGREYQYELVQDLRSQLLEEELRNKDRHAALLSLEREMERYRPYLGLTPEQIVARAKTAPPAEKKLLQNLGGGGPRSGLGYGPLQMYFRLSAQEMAALRAGEELHFSQEPQPGERLLPPDVARGILQSWNWERFIRQGDNLRLADVDDPDAVIPIHTVPEVRAFQTLSLSQTELGQYGLHGLTGFYLPEWKGRRGDMRGPYAVGMSPSVLKPENASINARLSQEPALRPRISLQPQPSCRPTLSPDAFPDSMPHPRSAPEPQVTTADVLEALHRATHLPLVADYYTRLYKPEALSVRRQTIFEALNQVSDAMRLRWQKEGDWLQFRSTSFYDDRLKEVPNRLLARWAAARQKQGLLTLEDLVEIAQLSDVQLQGEEMAQGARECYGLIEWDVARNHMVLPNLRFLVQFTPERRQEILSERGLPFTRMSLAQQQGFLARALGSGGEGLQSFEDLAGATLRVDYWQPGWYEWRPPGPRHLRWLVPVNPGPDSHYVPRPRVRERAREAALAALRRVDPAIREAVRAAAVHDDPRIERDYPCEEAQIVPTNLDLVTIYIPSTSIPSKHGIQFFSIDLCTGPG